MKGPTIKKMEDPFIAAAELHNDHDINLIALEFHLKLIR
jgi:hypothetical protein